MKKLLTLCLLAALILSGCAAGTSTEDNSLNEILDKKELIIGYTDYPPFALINGSDVTGFDIDIAKEVAKRMGVELKLKYIDWDAKTLELNSKSIDAIWNGFTITEERSKEVTFTKPYLNNSIAVMTLKGSSIQKLADLAGKNVGVELQSSGQSALEAKEDVAKSLASLTKYTTISEALLALRSGAIDAIVADENYALYVTRTDTENYQIANETFNPEYYGIGLRLGSTALANKIDEIIREMTTDGTATEISKKWFGEDLIIRE